MGKGVEKVLSHDSQSGVLRVAFSPDGATLATGHSDFTCVLWDVKTGKKRATLTGHTGEVISLDFSPDGAILATGGAESEIRLWDVASGKTPATSAVIVALSAQSVLPRDGRTSFRLQRSRTAEALGLARRQVPGIVRLGRGRRPSVR